MERKGIIIVESEKEEVSYQTTTTMEYTPCMVVEGESGYNVLDYHWGEDRAVAEKLAEDYQCEMRHDIFKDSFDLHTTKNKPRVPKIEVNCIFEIDRETLKKVSERSEMLGVIFDNETVWFSNHHEVHDWVTEGIIVSSNETGKALYTCDNVIDIVNSIPDKTNMVFKFASDFPCKLSYGIVEGFEIEWVLAPRLECD